jgi:hypothetical protein
MASRLLKSAALRAAAVLIAPAPAGSAEPSLNDTFDGDALDESWTLFESVTTTATLSVHDGELDYQVSAGGSNGSFWFDAHDGVLLHKTVTGDFDARCRIRVRNTADSGNPPLTSFRIAGLAAHDPDRTTEYNYVHVGLGATNTVNLRAEWKTTDSSDSAFNSIEALSGAGDLEGDLRIVRVDQVFTLYAKLSDTPLDDDEDWTLITTVDRTDNTIPDRNTNGGAADNATPMPDTLQVGLILYSSTGTHNIRMFVDEFQVSQ